MASTKNQEEISQQMAVNGASPATEHTSNETDSQMTTAKQSTSSEEEVTETKR